VKQAAQARIGRARGIVVDDVRELVSGGPAEPLSGRDGLVRLSRGGDVEKDSIAGRWYRRRVRAVAEVLKEDADAPVGYVVEQSLVGGEPAQEALRRARHEVVFTGIEINNPQLLGLDELEIGGPGRQCSAERDERCREVRPELPTPPSVGVRVPAPSALTQTALRAVTQKTWSGPRVTSGPLPCFRFQCRAAARTGLFFLHGLGVGLLLDRALGRCGRARSPQVARGVTAGRPSRIR
jgi:hypothetical protein